MLKKHHKLFMRILRKFPRFYDIVIFLDSNPIENALKPGKPNAFKSWIPYLEHDTYAADREKWYVRKMPPEVQCIRRQNVALKIRLKSHWRVHPQWWSGWIYRWRCTLRSIEPQAPCQQKLKLFLEINRLFLEIVTLTHKIVISKA